LLWETELNENGYWQGSLKTMLPVEVDVTAEPYVATG